MTQLLEIYDFGSRTDGRDLLPTPGIISMHFFSKQGRCATRAVPYVMAPCAPQCEGPRAPVACMRVGRRITMTVQRLAGLRPVSPPCGYPTFKDSEVVYNCCACRSPVAKYTRTAKETQNGRDYYLRAGIRFFRSMINFSERQERL